MIPGIPFGRVEGTLAYNGRSVGVAGTGYHDHNWGNIDLNKGHVALVLGTRATWVTKG